MYKQQQYWIETTDHQLKAFPLKAFTKADQHRLQQLQSRIQQLHQPKKVDAEPSFIGWGLVMALLCLGGWAMVKKQHYRPAMGLGLMATAVMVWGFTTTLTTTDPQFVQSAFAPFIPQVATSYDSQYFYVESKGIPNHTMMVGISSHGWQQQVPVPQCYIGTNHWSIPLNPVMAATPIAIDNVHFTRGAIALAANGVPIFNYHTNTGVDSFTDGQLDNYGGHCGRGDDYHYHIAPLHLYTLGQTSPTLPCAFAFDGFAVYGSVEPDGSPMQTLDANHGHMGSNGVYHYHGTSTAPYMIANFVGQVTEDATYQLIPQASAHPVRNENWTPLSGALITGCTPNPNPQTGYTLSYSLNGTAGYATQFSWSGTTYTFNYITPTGTTTKTYNGFTQCTVPLGLNSAATPAPFRVICQPQQHQIQLVWGNIGSSADVLRVELMDVQGRTIQQCAGWVDSLQIPANTQGVYFVGIQTPQQKSVVKCIIE